MVKKILMICLGNICRSPIAEAVMIDTIEKAGASADWKVDSAAIGDWHRGSPPDHRALSTMKKHDLPYNNRARQIKKQDFHDFDYIFGMDEENMGDLRSLAPANSKAKLLMLGDFGLDKSDRIIVDPYYQRGDAGFEKAYQQCVKACAAFFEQAVAGNTCRSPMAESVMKHWVQEYDLSWEVDSAGLRTWNVGRKPDDRCIKVLAENSLATDHVGRQITIMDFYNNDYILAMDEHNLHELETLAKDSSQQRCAKVELLGKYIDRAEDQIIRDPYFCNSIGGFRCAFLQITESCQNFIAEHMYTD